MIYASVIPTLHPPVRDGRKGRTSLVPSLIKVIHDTELGEPVVLKKARIAGGIYRYKNLLKEVGYETIVVSPNTERLLSEDAVVTNMSNEYALVTTGMRMDSISTPMSLNVQIFHRLMLV
jgi:hypothetical protein